MTERELAARTGHSPITTARIAGDLRALGVVEGGVLLVHAATTAASCSSAWGTTPTRRCTWPRPAAPGAAATSSRAARPCSARADRAGCRGAEDDFPAIGAAFADETGLERIG